jgi:hypothetical protein
VQGSLLLLGTCGATACGPAIADLLLIGQHVNMDSTNDYMRVGYEGAKGEVDLHGTV